MTQPPTETEPCELVLELSLTGSDRWSMYHRLQSLDIPCSCQTHRPLQVHCRSTLDAIQCWSIARQLTQSRLVLAQALDACLELSIQPCNTSTK